MKSVVNSGPTISVINQIELLSFTTREDHYQLLIDFIQDSTIIPLTSDIVEKSISIRRHYKTKLPDAIIAATAVVHSLTLITRNTTDFKNIYGLTILNPWETTTLV